MRNSYCYDEPAKKRAASSLKTKLRKVADELGLTKEQFDLRFNPGGIAVWGEVILHSDNIYIQASKGYDLEMLVRTCKGRKDYTGGPNRWIKETASPSEIASFVRSLLQTEG